MNAEVRNNPTEYRYEVWADGELAGYTQYGLGRGRIAFVHDHRAPARSQTSRKFSLEAQSVVA
jgi:hypothetical protein